MPLRGELEQGGALHVSKEALLGMAKHDPDAYWRSAMDRPPVPPAVLVELLFDSALLTSATTQAGSRLLRKLLQHVVAAECEASLDSGYARGSTALYVCLCRTVCRRYEGALRSLGSAESFLSNLDFFLAHSGEPGETCFALTAFQVVQQQLAVQTSLESLVRVFSRHLHLFASFKQQAKLSFVPWIEAEKLLVALTKTSLFQAKQCLQELKSSLQQQQQQQSQQH